MRLRLRTEQIRDGRIGIEISGEWGGAEIRGETTYAKN
jgi:hypothetical protein